METDMAHTDWSQLWSTGRSDRVASLSVSLSVTMTMLSYLPTPIDTLVRSSRAYTRPLPRVTRGSPPIRGGDGDGGGWHGVWRSVC